MERPKRGMKMPVNLKEFVLTSDIDRQTDGINENVNDLLHFSKKAKQEDTSSVFNCSQCNHTFINGTLYEKHMKTHKVEKETFLCEDCGKCLSSLYALSEHLNIHRDVKPFKCDTCGHQSRQLSVHMRHLLTHQISRPFECTICNKIFKQNEYLRRHMRKHRGEKPYTCEKCKKCFSEKTDLNRHQQSHSNKKKYFCSFCKKNFKMQHNLTAHIKRHTNTNIQIHKCKKCNSGFSQQSLLESHMKSHFQNALLLDLYKKDAKNFQVATFQKDKRKLPTYHALTLPKGFSFNNIHWLSSLSLQINNISIPVSMIGRSFGNSDHGSLMFVDQLEECHLQSSKMRVALVNNKSTKALCNEEKETQNIVNLQKNGLKKSFNVFDSLASAIENTSNILSNEMVNCIEEFINLSEKLKPPFDSETCKNLHNVICKLQWSLITSLEKSTSISSCEKEKSESSSKMDPKIMKFLNKSSLFLENILQKHFQLVLK